MKRFAQLRSYENNDLHICGVVWFFIVCAIAKTYVKK